MWGKGKSIRLGGISSSSIKLGEERRKKTLKEWECYFLYRRQGKLRRTCFFVLRWSSMFNVGVDGMVQISFSCPVGKKQRVEVPNMIYIWKVGISFAYILFFRVLMYGVLKGHVHD